MKSFGKTKSGRRGSCHRCVWRQKRNVDPDRFKRKRKAWWQRNPASAIVEDSRKNDKRKGLECNITTEFVSSLISNPCMYCAETSIRMTLDRIENGIGHILGNVVPCCIRCNYIRGSMPYDAWIHIVPLIRSAREAGLFGDWRSLPVKCPHRLARPRTADSRSANAGSNPAGVTGGVPDACIRKSPPTKCNVSCSGRRT